MMPPEQLERGLDRTGHVRQRQHDHKDAPAVLAVGQVAAFCEAALDPLELRLRGGHLEKKSVGIHCAVVVHARDIAACLCNDAACQKKSACLVRHFCDEGLSHNGAAPCSLLAESSYHPGPGL